MNPEMYGLTSEEFMMADKALSVITPELITQLVSVFALLMVWSFIWKGIALWKASQNDSVPWFVALLLVNTLGILELLYIFVFSKKTQREDNKKTEEEIVNDAVIKAELEKMKQELENESGSKENKEIA
jgi:hypothetical protein